MKRNGFQFALKERESKIGRLSTRFDFQGGSVTSVNSLYFIFIVILCVKYYGFFLNRKRTCRDIPQIGSSHFSTTFVPFACSNTRATCRSLTYALVSFK